MQQFAANQLYISSLGYHPRKEPPFYLYFLPIYPKPYLAYLTSNIDWQYHHKKDDLHTIEKDISAHQLVSSHHRQGCQRRKRHPPN